MTGLPFHERIEEFVEAHELLPRGSAVLVGVSGGVDSMVLLHVMVALGHAPHVLHVNYGLRGADADADEALVRQACEALDVDLVVERVDTSARAHVDGTSIQVAARDIRYERYAAMATARGIDRVAVGHNADDQAETMLLNLIRGTGIEGVAGMPVTRPLRQAPAVQLIRPLLDVRRREIEAYARAHDVPWREDATNTSEKYRRGIVRKEVLPVIVRHFGDGAVDALARSARLVRAYVDEYVMQQIANDFEFIGYEAGGYWHLAHSGMQQLPPVRRRRVILEALRRWFEGAPATECVVREVEALLWTQRGRRVVMGAGTVWGEEHALIFVPAEPDDAPSWPVAIEPDETVALPGGVLSLDFLDEPPDTLDEDTPDTVYVDAARLRFPLHVRPWKAGDRLQPLGMEGRSKAVSDLLTDRKVESFEKKDALVLVSGETIVWVVGHRLDHRFRVRRSTREVARLVFEREPKPGSQQASW